MTAITTAGNHAGSSNAVLDSLQAQPKAEKEKLGKNAFLELMITQLQNQDPLSPQQNGEFISQLAQFSSVEGLNNLNTSVSGMAASLRSTQALQASTLVGRSVRVPSDSTLFDGTTALTGAAVLPEATSDLRISITNDAGAAVTTFDLGAHTAGDVRFKWDGTNSDGAVVAPGRYHLAARGLIGRTAAAVPVELNANVDSVNVTSTGDIVLNVAGIGPIKMGDVKEIR